ncbi:MAG TPA: twin-arginine translocase subunit TatC [Candidatus Baltobacteraceae bacterium]|nr:twin-arginine translocase subunit TatC [Candidatus Baltobacteraceae bacterium]
MADDHESERSDEAEGGPVKTFLEHLEDFRWVLIKSIVALLLGMLVCLCAANEVVQIIKWPLKHAPVSFPGTNQIAVVSFGTNHVGNFQLTPEEQESLKLGTNRFVSVEIEPLVLGTNQILGWHVNDNPAAVAAAQRMNVELVNLSPAGGFVVAFQVALYGGFVLASPFVFYFIAAFVFPALRIRERTHIYRGLVIGVGLFLIGVSFCYFILMPVALAAAQMYSNWLGLGAFQWRAEDYISFVCKFMLGMGLGFELPVVVLTLVKIGVLDYRTLSKARRYMIVINLILGAVLTTPEPITQIVMFVPLQLLYEITVWIAWYWDQPDRAKARRLLCLAFAGIVLLGALIWRYGWPWLRQHLNH